MLPIFVRNGWQKYDLFLTLLRENFGIPQVVMTQGGKNFGQKFSRKRRQSHTTDGFKSLRLLKIGKNSFNVGLPFDYSGYGMYSSPPNEFCIVNCPKLESIDIDESSFVNFEYFRLSKLPKLKSIRVASFGSVVPSSRGLSFEIKSIIDMILLMNRSS